MALYRNEEIQLWIIGVFVISALIKIVYSVSPTPYMLPVLTAVPPLSSQIRETVMIPVSDSEIEANKLYEEHLKSYGITEKAIRKICPPWEAKGCQCTTDKEQDEAIDLTCRGVFFSNFQTLKWPRMLVKLQLTNNNITTLPSRSFDLPHLNELVLSYNSLHNIDVDAFVGLKSMTRLVMNNCELTKIPGKALSRIPGLNILQMNGNSINLLEPDCLVSFKQLKNLYLEGNSMTKIPTKTLMELTSLETLNLGSNHLRNIEMGDFPVMKNLVVLLLKRNHLTEIPSGSLLNLTSLNVIDLDDNQLTSLPPDLVKLYHLQELFVSGNRIKFILKDDLPKSLTIIEMRTNPLIEFKTDSMINMKKLKKLTLSNSRSLETLPSFSGCESLEILWVDRSKLKELPHNLCQTSPRLKALELKSNRLTSVPELAGCRQLRLLDLAGNKIDSLYGNPFQTLVFLQDLLLSYNQIATIPYDAFLDLSSLQLLDLEGNNINFIHKDAFVTLIQLKDLNLGNNIFPDLPTTGLMSLNHLKTFNNPRLKEFPTTESFPKIETLVLSYAYHCCAFLPLKVRALETKVATVTETILPLPEGVNFSSLLNDSSLRDIMLRNGFEYPTFYGTIPTYEEYNEVEITRSIKSETLTIPIRCLPLPDPFLPCQDLFDWWTLRCGVWVVFLLAMLGNGTVVFVLIFSRSKMDVPRFLVCNLAAADFFMGVYLGLLAVVDASTLGEFRMYAIPWQMSAGCQLAGFLAVLSSELSVYTLAVITLERNYAITHAMHLNKRLSLRHAAYIMTIGWMFALTMAMLPLFGISDYRKFAVCLPFETTTGPGSLAYVIFLMFINGVAFLILMGCYLKMYCAIRGSQAWNSNDSRIAKRMALLVFTDFLCWSPIAFFSLTAVFGLHLISLEQAKVFTVFVLPLNSCCNPFLYAILTKQFKKDCVLICKAIEESRVTRGIGRCRHSSNFSNRQTPANTNSLVERSSRDLPPLIPGQTCACAKLLEQDKAHRHTNQPGGFSNIWRRLLCHAKQNDTRRGKRSDQYAHQIAEIQQKQHKRAGSMSSSENFSSSRSDSWRHGPPHHYCGIQLRKLDPRWRHSSWLITRKTSQDSNLSSSRNDSSGSATTASTSTWRMSRSSAGASTPLPPGGTSFSSTIARQSLPGSKPRLVRQSAIHDDSLDLSSSPPRLGVRFLPTIPSAADSSVQLDEDTVTNNDNNGNDDVGDVGDVVGGVVSGGTQYYAVLQSGNPLTTLSSPKDKTKPP